ncbi:MAG: hypothetical protein JWM98_2438 [Thermoleophilia bacterium]|nr:hypothetical protein [Thermoleophilia bacterium]
MTISGFNPLTTNPGLVPSGATLAGTNPLLAGSNPLLAGSTGGLVPTGAQLAAMSGVGEQPGIGTRLVSAMKAAISELRGQGASEAQIRDQVLAMQAQAPVTLAKQATVAKPVAKKPVAKAPAKKVVHAKTWKTLTPHPTTAKPAVAPKPAAVAPAVTAPMAALPSNATQLPSATVYSYDQNGNPIAAPTMSQLGLTPTMLQGLTGAAQAVDPEGPQVNATNQTNLSGIGSGVGVPVPVTGATAVPVLGAPIAIPVATTPNSPGDTAPTTPHNGASANQQVTNRNASDLGSLNQGIGGYGAGYGSGYGTPWDPTGGVATPYSPYGSSMTGAYALGTQKPGFFSRLFS